MKRSDSLAYKVWRDMKYRCFTPSCNLYQYYGARGITVSEDWLEFDNFYRDMGERPSKYHTLERLDVSGNYCKENCIWVTKSDQSHNKTNNVEHVGLNYNSKLKTYTGRITHMGKRLTTPASTNYYQALEYLEQLTKLYPKDLD